MEDATEAESSAGKEAVEEAGPVLHPSEPGLDQRGQLADVAFSQVGQGQALRCDQTDSRSRQLALMLENSAFPD